MASCEKCWSDACCDPYDYANLVYSGVTVNVTPYEPREMVPLSELYEWLPREDLFYTGPSPDQVSKGRYSQRIPLVRSERDRHPRIKRSSAKG